MTPDRLQNSNVVNQITNWIKTNSLNNFSITNELQLASLDESIDAFLSKFPGTSTVSGNSDMKWILTRWVSNMTALHDLQTGEVIRYRGIEIPAKRHDEIKRHLLNETRKMVSYYYKTTFIN